LNTLVTVYPPAVSFIYRKYGNSLMVLNHPVIFLPAIFACFKFSTLSTMSATSSKPGPRDHGKLADFIMFSQREFLLNLSRDLSKDNISFAQFFLLSYLATSKELTMTDIARKMGHSTAAATGLVDRLEKLGYMERTHAIDDRRKVLVRITPKGVDLVSRMRDELQSRIADAMLETQTTDANSFITAYRQLDEAVA
jgi:DNA-binding MarR family transcriptional regulator